MRTLGILLGFFNVPFFCFLQHINQAYMYSVQLSAPDEVIGTYGGFVTVSCQYDQQFREYTKYWCRGQIYDLCSIVVKTPKERPSETNFIEDNKEAGVFTVTMTSLSESDEDMYWCVISRYGRNLFAGVRLHVYEHKEITTPTPTTSTTQDAIRWWEILRWILFVFMLCCLVTTHVAVWRIKNSKENM